MLSLIFRNLFISIWLLVKYNPRTNLDEASSKMLSPTNMPSYISRTSPSQKQRTTESLILTWTDEAPCSQLIFLLEWTPEVYLRRNTIMWLNHVFGLRIKSPLCSLLIAWNKPVSWLLLQNVPACNLYVHTSMGEGFWVSWHLLSLNDFCMVIMNENILTWQSPLSVSECSRSKAL